MNVFTAGVKKRSLKLTMLLALAALPALLAACGSDDPTATPDRSAIISFPYLFEGTFTVAGEPGPAGLKMFTMLNGEQAGNFNETGEGTFTNITASPNKPGDLGKTITFHIGDPEGEYVQADQTMAFHAVSELQRLQIDLTFPELP